GRAGGGRGGAGGRGGRPRPAGPGWGRPPRRYRTPLAAAATFAALLLAGVVVSTREAVRATRAEGEAVEQRDLAEEAEQAAARERDAARDARGRLRRPPYASDMKLAQAAWQADHVSRVLP